MSERRLVVPLVALLLSLAGSLATAQTVGPEVDPADDSAGVIASASFECDLPRCADAGERERLLGITGARPGAPWNRTIREASRAVLLQTSLFRDVQIEETSSGRATDIVFRCAGATIIRGVRIRAGLSLESEIRRRVFLRSGQPWVDDPDLIERQRLAIVEYFERLGRFGTEVTISTEEVEPFVTDVTIDIRRGRRIEVGQIYVRGNQSLDYDEIRDQLLSRLSLTRSFTSELFQQATDAVISEYRRRGWIQARFTRRDAIRDDEAGTVDLYLEVSEGERWDVEFLGNRAFDRGRLLQALTFQQTGFIDDEEILFGVRELRALYETVGLFFARIEAEREDRADGTHRISFRIDEGFPAEIREIRYEGMTAFTTLDLEDLVETTVYDILYSGGYLQRAMLGKDLNDLLVAYRERGYLQARISRVVMVGENQGRDLYLTVHVDEGPLTRVSGVSFLGNQALSESALIDGLTLVDGAVFGPALLEEDRSRILASYYPLGYPAVTPNAECVLPGGRVVPCQAPEFPADCRYNIAEQVDEACERVERGGRIIEECLLLRADPACQVGEGITADRIDIRYSIDEGPAAVFGDVFVLGNFRTRDSVLARELRFAPGDAADYRAVLQAQSNMRSLGLFDAVRVDTLSAPIPDENGRTIVPIIVQVEEAPARYVEWGLGAGLETGVATSEKFLLTLSNDVRYRDINLWGRALVLTAGGGVDIDLFHTDRARDGELAADAILLFQNPRLSLLGLLDDPWESSAQLGWIYDHLAVPPFPQREEIGFETAVRERSDAVAGLTVEMGASVRRTESCDQSRVDTVDACADPSGFEPAFILSVTPRLSLERRDNPLNPTEGLFAELSVELADDFVAVLDSASFTQFTGRGSMFWPLGERFVLGANLRAGLAIGGILSGFHSAESIVLPLSEQYRLGGVSSVRGFPEGGISTGSADQFGGDVLINGNVELRYPFVRDWDLNGAVFLDAGALARDPDELEFGSVRSGTGIGLRWLIADLIPVVLDYGAVLNRRPGEAFSRLHVNVGYTF